MRKFGFQVLNMGLNSGKYIGAFSPRVQDVINSVIYGDVLHLYSGSSLIGTERIDLEHPNATMNCRVEDFIKTDTREWDWVLLDPPYALKRRSKLSDYAETSGLSADVYWRREITRYFQGHTDNVLWFDICAPIFRGFYREKLWLFLPGSYMVVRVLSWLKREMKPLL